MFGFAALVWVLVMGLLWVFGCFIGLMVVCFAICLGVGCLCCLLCCVFGFTGIELWYVLIVL